jgi:hypothetical protein
MPQSILMLFKRFPYEVAAIGRLLAGYSTIELDLLSCVQVAGGNDFNTVFRATLATAVALQPELKGIPQIRGVCASKG